MVIWLSGRRYGETLVARASDRLPHDAPILPADRAALMDSVQRLRVAFVDLLASTLFYAFGPMICPNCSFSF